MLYVRYFLIKYIKLNTCNHDEDHDDDDDNNNDDY